jgi:hypothetical protein
MSVLRVTAEPDTDCLLPATVSRMSWPEYGGGLAPPQVPQRAIPPVHHVWVASPGDGRRLYRSALLRTAALWRLGILWAILVALLVFVVVEDPSHNITWLVVALVFPILFVFLLLRRGKPQEALMAPGSVWASGFGANELLIVTPVSTLVIEYAALVPPRVTTSTVLIRTRYGASTTWLPLQLFPPDALAFLRQRTTR